MFQHRWQTKEVDFHDELSRGAMSRNGWTASLVNTRSARIELTVAMAFLCYMQGLMSSRRCIFPKPTPYLPRSVGHAEPWGIVPAGSQLFPGLCLNIRANRVASHMDFSKNIKFDIFPKTLDSFYELTVKGREYALAW